MLPRVSVANRCWDLCSDAMICERFPLLKSEIVMVDRASVDNAFPKFGERLPLLKHEMVVVGRESVDKAFSNK